jgi:MYXO-CTERM domain-containing protein
MLSKDLLGMLRRSLAERHGKSIALALCLAALVALACADDGDRAGVVAGGAEGRVTTSSITAPGGRGGEGGASAGASHRGGAAGAGGAQACPEHGTEIDGNVGVTSAEDLQALSCVSVIHGNLTIDGTNAARLEGLQCLRRVDGNLQISNNGNLGSLDGLNGLESVGGNLILRGNPKLVGAAEFASHLKVSGKVELETVSAPGSQPADSTTRSLETRNVNIQPGTTITAPTTWTLANSPYYVGNTVSGTPGPAGDLTIGVGGVLTIEPGVEVLFASGDSDREIIVDGGQLIANGAPGLPIVFRHATLTSAGAWEGIRFTTTGSGSITNAIIRHADFPLEFAAPVAANFTLSNVTIDTFASYGVYTSGSGGLTLTNFTIDGSAATPAYGIYSSSTPIALSGANIRGVGSYGIYLSSATGSSITNSTLTGTASSSDVGLYLASTTSATVTGNRFKDWNIGVYTSQPFTCHHNVFWGTQSYGVQVASSSMTFVADYNTFYGQTGGGIYASSTSTYMDLSRNVFGATPYAISGSWSLSDVSQNVYWGGTTALSGTDNLHYNGLLKDPANGDFTPTERSPARWWDPATANSAAGAVPYAGDPSPAGFYGAWYTPYTFAAGSTSTLTGDMLIHPSTTITLLPGATLKMAKGDVMQGGTSPNLVEIYAAGEFAADGTTTNFVTLTSAETTPAPGDWSGIVILQSTPSFNVSEARIQYATDAIDLRSSSHVIQDVTIEQASDAGIKITAGAPTINGATISNSLYGIYASSGALTLNKVSVANSGQHGIYGVTMNAVTFTNVNVSKSGAAGVYLGGTSFSWIGGSSVDNVTYGLYATASGASPLQNLLIARNGSDGVYGYAQTHTHNTIVSNGRYGIYTGSYGVTVASSSITHNVSSAIYTSNTLTCTYTNLWGNGGGNGGNFAQSSACFGYNPLYADFAGGDYRPTSRSPNRVYGPDGYIGVQPYANQLTGPMMGIFWENYTFVPGSYQVPGDLVVPSGRTVTLQPGTVLLMKPQADDMGGGEVTNRIDVRVLTGGLLAIDGTGAPIRMTSDTTTPAPGDWAGLVVTDGFTSPIANTILDYPQRGVYAVGPSAPPITNLQVNFHSGYGLYFDGVNHSTNNVNVDRARIIGPGTGATYGVYLNGACRGKIRNVYATHHGTGVGIYVASAVTALDLVNNTLVTQQYGIQLAPAAGTFNVSNNLIANSKSYAVMNNSTSSTSLVDNYRNNLFFSALGNNLGIAYTTYLNSNSNNLTTDPLIEDDDWQEVAIPRWWDGAVWAESLARNAGLATAPNLPTTDIRGKNRTLETAPDIGAYEFDPAANQEPRADPVSASFLVPANEAVTLDGSAAYDPDGTIQTAFWTIEPAGNPVGPGTVVAGLNAQYTFPNAGDNQYAFLTVIDDDGAEDHRRVKFNVDRRPVADAGVEVYGNTGETVNFKEASTDADGTIASWRWDFGDGTNSLTQNPSHVYSSAGNYTVTLTVTDNLGLTAVDTTIAHITGGSDTVGPNVQHSEISDGQVAGVAVAIVATITDPSGVANAYVQYRAKGSTSAQFVAMTNTSGSTWSGTIPASAVTTAGVEYWVSASDSLGNPSVTPANAPSSAWDFLVVAEKNPPQIVHTEIADGQTAGSTITVQATISDATGVASAYLYYRGLGSTGSFTVVSMAQGASNVWSAQIPGPAVTSPGIEYYIVASDKNSVPNRATSPTGAPTLLYNFTVVGGAGTDVTPPSISHVAIANGQTAGQPVTITADILDAGGVTAASVYYRTAGSGAYTQTSMARVSGNTWQGQIPASAVTTAGVDYYIRATDAANNVALDPSGAPGTVHTFTVVNLDNTGPSIVHTAIANGQPANAAVSIQATVTDPSGVQWVRLRYRTQGGVPTYAQVNLTNVSGNVWQGQIPATAVQAPGVDYYLQASDGSATANLSYAPPTAPTTPYSFTVAAPDSTGPTIVHTPIPGGQTAGASVLISADVTDPSGIAGAQLAYRASGTSAFTLTPMAVSSGPTYQATIPGSAVTTAGVDYYILATDASAAANQSASPASAWYTFTVTAADTAGPVISHSAPSSVSFGQNLVISASIADVSGVASASVVWSLDGGSPTTTPMTASGSTYTATIPAASITNGTSQVRYYITALDTKSNASRHPTGTGTHNVTVVYPDTTPPTVSINPISGPVGEGIDLVVTIQASDTQSAIASVTLFYRTNGSATFKTAPATGSGPYTATIPGADVTPPALEMYAQAGDSANNIGTSTPNLVVNVQPAPDTTPPTLVVTPVADGQLSGTDVAVLAQITDASSVTGRLYYRATGTTTFQSVAMTNVSGTTYQGIIPKSAVQVPGIQYYVTATDSANNTATQPTGGASAPLAFTVQNTDGAGPTISHTPAAGPIAAGSPLLVSATVVDPSGVASASLYWRTQGGSTFTQVAMTRGTGDTWSATIASSSAPAVEYYLAAADSLANGSTLPANAPTTWFTVGVVAPDTTPPVITHTKVADGRTAGSSVGIDATITDAGGVASASVYYRATGTSSWTSLGMTNTAGNTWSVTLPGTIVTVAGVDYYIEAIDTANNHATAPTGAPGSVLAFTVIAGADTTPPTITHTKVSDGQRAGTAVDVTATVADPGGVAQVTLFYRQTGAASFTSLACVRQGTSDVWVGTIPGTAVQDPGIDYYLQASDQPGNVARSPSGAPTSPYTFTVKTTEGAGCGCRTANRASAKGAWLLLALGVLGMRRRRRRG